MCKVVTKKCVIMNHLAISRVLALLTSLAITFGSYDQVIKIWKTRSARDISYSLIVAWLLNEFAWVYYGAQIKEPIIVVLSVLNMPAALIGALGYWKYRQPKGDEKTP